MKTLLEMTKNGLRKFARPRLLAVMLIAGLGLALGGCAVDGGYGYGASYYAPDYAPYYTDYGYNGYPYWGGGPYAGSTIVIGERSHRGYYGGHHWRGDGFRHGRGFRGGRRGGWHGGRAVRGGHAHHGGRHR